MSDSPRMLWPYPSRDADPWYDGFEDFAKALDASGYASREDRSIILSGGGEVSWDLGTETLSWTSAIVFSVPLTGFLLSIAAGSVVLADGQVFYTTLVRQPLQNRSVAGVVANQIPGTPDGDNTIAIAVRIGNNIYFRTGFSMEPGSVSPGVSPLVYQLAIEDTGVLVDGSTKRIDFHGAVVTNPSPGEVRVTVAGGGPEGWQADFVDVRLYTLAAVPVEEVVGQGAFDGSRVGTGTAYFFGMMTPTIAIAGWGQLRLYDIGPVAGPPTPLVAVATLSTAVPGGPQYKQQALVVGAVPAPNQIANSARMYEVRAIMSGSVGDKLYVGGGGMDVR